MKRKKINEVLTGLYYALIPAIDKKLAELGDAHVSTCDSDNPYITIAVNPDSVSRKDVIEIMKGAGYKYYDCGTMGDFIMMSFCPDAMAESKNTKKKTINEAQLRDIVKESVKRVLNEISTDMKGAAYVKASNEMDRLQAMKDKGISTFKKNGQTMSVGNELNRLKRQQEFFGNSLSRDMAEKYGSKYFDDNKREQDSLKKRMNRYDDDYKSSLKFSKDASDARDSWAQFNYERNAMMNKEKRDDISNELLKNHQQDYTNGYGYSIKRNPRGNGGMPSYNINTPHGHFQADEYGIRRNSYNAHQDSRGAQRKMDDMGQEVAGLMGYEDELGNKSDWNINDNERMRRNVQAYGDWANSLPYHEEQRHKREREQADYDRKLFHWGKKRPEDYQMPSSPEWERDENGNYDGYFAGKPEDYTNAINKIKDTQAAYKAALKNRRKQS